VASALALAACGGSGDDNTASTPAASTGSSVTVTLKAVDGIGKVLVDSAGRALYTPDEETSGKVLCTGACTSDWEPLTADAGAPKADGAAGKLAVIDRPDGTRQVTAGGKPLYTFTDDPPGKVTGDGFSDDFDGKHFTWHAVLAGGERSTGSQSGASQSSGSKGDFGY
jgi:predicted lipoprotein with Yx(FWY)xxD motif